MDNVAGTINNTISETYQRLVTSPRENGDVADDSEYRNSF